MDISTAFEIVLELAQDNVLNPKDCMGDESLLEEAKKQQKAVDEVSAFYEAYFVNFSGKEDE